MPVARYQAQKRPENFRILGMLRSAVSVCIAASVLCRFAAAQEPVKVDALEVQRHYLDSSKVVHSGAKSIVRVLESVTLQVVVDAEGNVESARAISGPQEFFEQAEAAEAKRKFKPFEQDGAAIRATFEDYVLVAPQEQWADQKVPFPDIKDWNTLKIGLKRTSCYGPCPDYSVEVQGNTREVTFNGFTNVFVQGQHRATISKQELQELVAAFRHANYFSLNDRYSLMVTDSPTFVTSIEFDGKKKSVVDYVGLEAGMPEVVRDLENSIDRVVGTEKWIKGNDQTGAALLAEHFDFRADTEENRALFARVVATGWPDLVQLFLSQGAPAFSMTKDGEGALVSAAGRGDLNLVARLLRSGGTPAPELMTCTLGAAARSGNLDLLEFLIGRGADPNGPACGKYEKVTVLMQATLSHQPEMVQTILKYHPDVNAKSPDGYTALAFFLLQGLPRNADPQKIVSLLVTAGADVNGRDNHGRTPIFYACINQQPEAIRALVNAGADVNVKDESGQTALMSCFDVASVNVIVDAGADLDIRNNLGRTAAEAAREMNATEKAELLEAAMQARQKH